jgi:hypothetical protein
MKLDIGASDLDTSLVFGSESELRIAPRRLLGARREEGHVVEVVLDVRLRLDEAEAKPLLNVEVHAAVLAIDVDAVEPAQRGLQVADPQRNVFQRPTLAWPFGVEQRQLAASSVGPDERELVRLLDHVHREPVGDELRDGVAIRDPKRDVVESLGPHPEFTLSTERGPDPVYFLRLTAASSCRLFIRERPLMLRRLASL